MLPLLAKRLMDGIIAEVQDGQFRLESGPSSTLDYVNSLTFLEEIQERVSKEAFQCQHLHLSYVYVFFCAIFFNA